MKKVILFSMFSFLFLFFSCGPSAREKERIEKERADSISQAEAREKALKLEQERQDSIRYAETRKARWAQDSIEIVELLPSFNISKDQEFDNKRIYVAKGISTSHYRNAAYLSFTTRDSKVDEIYINIEIVSKGIILLDHAAIIIGDDVYNLNPIGETKMDNQRYPSSAEWMTAILSSNLMNKILEADLIKVKAIGDDESKLINISPEDLTKMKETIKLYQLFKNSKVIE